METCLNAPLAGGIPKQELLVSRIERSAFSLSSFGGLFSLILYYSHLNNLIATR